jgi:hypothetical protein
MSRTRSALACLLATTTLIGCATADFAQDVELDNLHDALDQAVLAGDYQLAMELGYEYVGQPIDGGPGMIPVDGFLSAIIEPTQDGGSVSIMRGRLTEIDTEERHELGGVMATPLEDQVRGVIEADTRVLETETMGRLMGDFRTVGEITGSGPLRATWNVQGVEDGYGRMFGVYERLDTLGWDQGARIRIDVAGLTLLTITEDKLWVTPLMDDATFEGEIGGAIVNSQAYELVYSERSCPDYEGAECTSEPYSAPLGDTMDLSNGVEMVPLMGRGGMAVVAEPTAENEYTTEILINDMNYYGASTYELQVTPTL